MGAVVGERRFALEIVGGPFDGLRGLYWSDLSGELVPPDVIFIGTCPGDGTCYGSVAHCHAQGGGRPHSSYWTPVEGEDARPAGCLRYQRSRVDEELLVATYVRGNMEPQRARSGGVEVDEPAPLVTARMATYDGLPPRPRTVNCPCILLPFEACGDDS